MIAALTAASPLAMSIQSVQTTGQLATVEQLNLAVTNNTGRTRAARLHYRERHDHDGLLAAAGAGPRCSAPHQRASYTIVAPSYFAMPSISNGFQVLAFSSDPASVSRTSAYVASLWRVVLQPAAISSPSRRDRTSRCTPRS